MHFSGDPAVAALPVAFLLTFLSLFRSSPLPHFRFWGSFAKKLLVSWSLIQTLVFLVTQTETQSSCAGVHKSPGAYSGCIFKAAWPCSCTFVLLPPAVCQPCGHLT